MRLFVALELPADVVAALDGWRPRDDALRPIAPENVHLTLAFLGERPDGDAERVGAVLERAARPVGEASLDGALWLPPRRARVLAVRLAGDGVVALQAEVAQALSDAIDWEPERRRFLPHVTVARVRSGARAPRLELAPLPDLGPFPPGPLTLFRSRLSPKGARYEPLARASLPEP